MSVEVNRTYLGGMRPPHEPEPCKGGDVDIAATASSHLAELTEAGLPRVEAAGRNRNYTLAGPAVGNDLHLTGRGRA